MSLPHSCLARDGFPPDPVPGHLRYSSTLPNRHLRLPTLGSRPWAPMAPRTRIVAGGEGCWDPDAGRLAPETRARADFSGGFDPLRSHQAGSRGVVSLAAVARRIPFHPRVAVRGMVSSADQLASSAGLAMLERGGSAADAMVAAASVMAVVGPHLCGLGGDALAMVKAAGEMPRALLSVGRAGSGADPDRLRADGHADMPLRGDIRSVPVPGAVDGWLALHERYGRLSRETVLEPAIALAEDGFAASLILAFASGLVADVARRVAVAPRRAPRAGSARPSSGVAPDASASRLGRTRRLLRRRVRPRPPRPGRRGVHARRPGPTSGPVGRTARAPRLRPRPVDGPSPLPRVI